MDDGTRKKDAIVRNAHDGMWPSKIGFGLYVSLTSRGVGQDPALAANNTPKPGTSVCRVTTGVLRVFYAANAESLASQFPARQQLKILARVSYNQAHQRRSYA